MTVLAVNERSYRSEARRVIAQHSKSFSLAALLLGPELRDEASALYAYCRRADDAVDLVSPAEAPSRVAELDRELSSIYSGDPQHEPVLVEFQRLVRQYRIPRAYPAALIEGFQLDAAGKRYETLSELLHYCWCVAGSVGAMMCHLLGVRRERAVVHGVHLGMAMQLTNVCRDVAEDWRRERLYVPLTLAPELREAAVTGELPQAYTPALSRAMRRLLAEADCLYASGDAGLRYLPFRARWGVATARRVYAAIGDRILAQDADPTAGRTIVPTVEKAWHLAGAALTSVRISTLTPEFRRAELRSTLRFPADVLPG